MEPPTITIDEHAILRPWREEDIEHIPHIGNDERIADNLGENFPHPYTKEKAADWIDHCKEQYDDADSKDRTWCIEIDGKPAGGLGLEKFQYDHCMIGYWLGPEHWGKGHMTRIAQRAIQYAFEEAGVVKVWAGVYDHNPASGRVLEKLGFHKEATLEKHYKRRNGELVDEHRYAKFSQ